MKHMQYHGQKFKDCTPQERVLIEVKPPQPNTDITNEIEKILLELVLPRAKIIPYADGDKEKAELLGLVWRHWAENEARPLVTNATQALTNLIAEREREVIKNYVTDVVGERCKTKDTEDFPELTHSVGRCMSCEWWEIYDETLRTPSKGDTK
jgi:hypothetical protein